jgi:hypothetical protein
MSEMNTNDRAFPSTFHNGWGEPEKGMTLRDYFAAQAMQSMLPFYANRPEDIQDMANKAYAMADLMLKAREE